jgi:hypothetical protein
MMHPNNKDGVVMALMFRNVQNQAVVHRRTSNLIDPTSRSDIGEFDAIRNTWLNDPAVAADQAALTAKVEEYVKKHRY